jgi:Arf-GAP/SH3 domain/ANK repeat/PH domain-containing protein
MLLACFDSSVDPAADNRDRFWIVLDQGKLSEYSNWKQRLDLHMDPIDLRLASVREARNAERRFCFEVITPQFKRVYQATSEEDMNSWIMAINNALQSVVEGREFKEKPSTSHGDANFNRMDIGSVLMGKSSSVGHGSHNTSNIPFRRTTVGARPSTSRGNSFEDRPDKLLQMLRENDQGNSWCADCGSNNKVEWVSLNLAIIVCIECSGIHRSLGTHISKIRSLTLDTTSFTPDIIELLLLVGNRVSNMVFEARLDPATKLTPQATREQRLRFITAKYVDRAYVEPISATLSRFSTADDTLLAAIKRNEIQQILYALALRANPNVTDKSRGTHAVYLALAAADPAPPSPIPPQAQAPTPTVDRSPFPVAELLIQNGAEIPDSLPQVPLSLAAQAYVELKRGRKAAIEASGSYDGAAGSLPTTIANTAAASDKLQREREARLQKRVSAGGRLAKTPIPER